MMKRYIFSLLMVLGVSVFFVTQLQAQETKAVLIKGTVSDNEGNPIPSARIYFNGGANSVLSGPDGSFTINMEMSDIAVIEATGFETVRIDGVAISSGSDIRLQ